MTTQVRITEHTTTDDPYCTVESADRSQSGEFLGSLEEFKAEHPDVEIIEEVWS